MRHKSYLEVENSAERAKTKDIKVLKGLATYLLPYKWGLVVLNRFDHRRQYSSLYWTRSSFLNR